MKSWKIPVPVMEKQISYRIGDGIFRLNDFNLAVVGYATNEAMIIEIEPPRTPKLTKGTP